MNEVVYTVTYVGDSDPDIECRLVSSDVTVRRLDAETAENSRLETLKREASTPPPYLYRGRKERCFSRPKKKTRWRKG